MSADLQKGLIIAAVRLLINLPWIIAGAAAFLDNRRVKKRTVIAAICVIALFIFASNAILRGLTSGAQYHLLDQLLTLLTYIIIMAFFALCYRLHAAALVYVFCLIHAVSTLVNQLSYILSSLLLPPGTGISITGTPLYSLLMVGLSFVCAGLLYLFCRRMLCEAFEKLEPRSVWYLCIVPIIFLVIFNVTYTLMVRFNGEPSVSLLLILLFSAAIATYAVNLQAVMTGARAARLRTEAEETKKLLSVQERGYAQLLGNIEQAKAARHDLRFHLSIISGFAKQGDTAGLTDYLEDYMLRIDSKELHYCENAAVDVLVRHFVTQIEAFGSDCDCLVSLPAKSVIPDSDLCVVIGNLLENSLHALERQPENGFLRLRCTQQGQRVLITADNSVPSDFSGFREGIGLRSVSAVAERYSGSAKLEAAGGVFSASVILHHPA